MDARRRPHGFDRAADEAGDRRRLFRRAGAPGNRPRLAAKVVSASRYRCSRSVSRLPIMRRCDLLDGLAQRSKILDPGKPDELADFLFYEEIRGALALRE